MQRIARALALSISLAPFLLAGCLSVPDAGVDPAALGAANATDKLDEVRAEWTGTITASPFGLLAHNAQTEGQVGALQKEGFVFDIVEIPDDLRVELAWPGPGTAVVMVSTPRDEADKGGEYFTEASDAADQCLRVPPADLVPGRWQVMIHTSEAVMADYTFTVVTVGGKGTLLDEPHSPAEAGSPEAREALACDAAAEKA